MAAERSIHVVVCGYPYYIANNFHDFSLICNGLCAILMHIFKVELKTSHGLLLASTGLYINVGLLLCCN